MTWVDIVVLASSRSPALLAFVRGFVREVLGIGAWVGAAIVADLGLAAAPGRGSSSGSPTPDWVDPVDLRRAVRRRADRAARSSSH